MALNHKKYVLALICFLTDAEKHIIIIYRQLGQLFHAANRQANNQIGLA